MKGIGIKRWVDECRIGIKGWNERCGDKRMGGGRRGSMNYNQLWSDCLLEGRSKGSGVTTN